jgi:hypothetical protein
MNNIRFDMTSRVSKLRRQFAPPLPSKKRLEQKPRQQVMLENLLELDGVYGLLLQENGDMIVLNE